MIGNPYYDWYGRPVPTTEAPPKPRDERPIEWLELESVRRARINNSPYPLNGDRYGDR